MPVSKKRPGKGRRPRAVLLPLGIKRVHKTETPLLIALSAIGTDWFSIDQLDELFLHGDVVRRIGTPDIAPLGTAIQKAALSAKERYDRTNRLGFTGDEARTIKEAAATTVAWLRQQPNTKINHALDAFEHDTQAAYASIQRH